MKLNKLRDRFLSVAMGVVGGYGAMNVVGSFMSVPTQSYTDIYNAFSSGGGYEIGVTSVAVAVGLGVFTSAYPLCMKKIFGS